MPAQARKELLKLDKQTIFEQARENMYCSRCIGLLQIPVKSLQQGGTTTNALKSQKDINCLSDGSQGEMQDPSVHPWGGLTTTKDGSVTLLDCYLYSKSLQEVQNVIILCNSIDFDICLLSGHQNLLAEIFLNRSLMVHRQEKGNVRCFILMLVVEKVEVG